MSSVCSVELRGAPWGSLSRLLCLFGNFQDVQLNFPQLLLACVQTLDVLKAGVCTLSAVSPKTQMCVWGGGGESVQKEDSVLESAAEWLLLWSSLTTESFFPGKPSFIRSHTHVQTSSRLLLRSDNTHVCSSGAMTRTFLYVHMLQMQLQESGAKPATFHIAVATTELLKKNSDFII